MAKHIKAPQEWTVHKDYAEMYFIRRTGERVRIIASPEDVCWLSTMRWGIDGKRRAYTNWFTGKYYAMHRMVMNISGFEQIDHINNDPLDNRRENLRICTHSQNLKNRLPHSGSRVPFKGVSFDKTLANKPFCAKICSNGKRTTIGRYTTPEDAARAYDKRALELHGDFALTNVDLGLL